MQTRFRIVRHPCRSPTKLIKQLRKLSWRQWGNPKVLSWFSVRVTGHYCLHKLFKLTVWISSVSWVSTTSWKTSIRCAATRSPWSIQMHTFWCNNKRWRILAPNRTKLISLLSLLPAWWIPRIMFLELFWSCFSYALVLLPRLFALVANFDGQVYVICCFVPYICTGGELWCPVDVICVIAVIA